MKIKINAFYKCKKPDFKLSGFLKVTFNYAYGVITPYEIEALFSTIDKSAAST